MAEQVDRGECSLKTDILIKLRNTNSIIVINHIADYYFTCACLACSRYFCFLGCMYSQKNICKYLGRYLLLEYHRVRPDSLSSSTYLHIP